ncbi:LysM peptidoglycan-binding domain-containing protein [Micromonospora sp. NPDC050417]|uniref:LysM peptidoglycan-binding domain-containing protein n=1 Tax=Micromonospora sp. NPDC050417 TaxID=3364280 RepID=UPI0037BD1C5B
MTRIGGVASRAWLLGTVPLLVVAVLALAGTPARAVPLAVPSPSTTPGSGVMPSADPSAAGGVRYYVVGSGQEGQREYLYQIAVQTLGDGNRFREIFELNRGRVQPDGGQLTDPLSLQPGWILELPADASGPGVQIGPLPFPSPSSSPTEGAAAADTSGVSPYLMWAGGLGVMALLLAVALRLLRPRRGTRASASAPAPADAPAGIDDILPAVVPAAVPAVVPAAVPAVVPAAVPAVLPAAVPAAVPASTPDLAQVPRSAPEAGSAQARAAETGPGTAAERAPAPEPPALPRRGWVVVALSPLGAEPDHLDVRLLARDAGGAHVPYGWLGDGPTAGLMPVVLGRQDRWRFRLDLAATPDLFTVTGSAPAVRRQALSIARQLLAAGVTVTVVGNALGPDLPPGCRPVDAFPALESFGPASGPEVVISGPPRGAELTAARSLTARTASRVVPVLVGEVLRSRWSVLVTAAEADPAAGDDPGR